jgi:8-oxo-dGTP pyrophosphatase MutT (NUDIX family)
MTIKASTTSSRFDAAELLSQHNILAFKGPKAKTIHEFMVEIEAGESTLSVEQGRLIRLTSAIDIAVYSPDRTLRLIEHHRVFGLKVVPAYNENVRGKMKRGETPEEAAIREMREELYGGTAVQVGEIIFLSDSCTEEESVSYPGLVTRRIMYCFECNINPLLFRLQGYMERVGNRTTFFRWIAVE